MFFGFISKNTFAIMMHHMTINMFIQLILDSMDKNNIVYIIWYYSEDVVKPVICILFSVLFNKYVGSFLDEIYLRIVIMWYIPLPLKRMELMYRMIMVMYRKELIRVTETGLNVRAVLAQA